MFGRSKLDAFFDITSFHDDFFLIHICQFHYNSWTMSGSQFQTMPMAHAISLTRSNMAMALYPINHGLAAPFVRSMATPAKSLDFMHVLR